MDRQTAKTVTEDVLAEVAKVFERHGMKLDKQSVTYGDTYKLTLTAHIAQLNESGLDEGSVYATAFKRNHMYYGLKAEALGAVVDMPGRGAHTFIGLAVTRRKFPYAFKNAQGKVQLFTEDVLRHFPQDVRS